MNASVSGEEIHLFHRIRHHSDFTYFGKLVVKQYTILIDSPSKFVFGIL
jgi:hypothetical protein